jgi:type IX secretion system PorP/SprF family membrane protein
MKNLYILSAVILFVGLSIETKAQGDPYFSQYMNNPLELNPANAGLFQGNARAALNYKRQYANIGEPFTTIGGSVDFQAVEFNQDFFGVGLNIVNDKAGVSEASNLNANLSLAYTKTMDRYANHYVSLGLNLGLGQKSLTTTDLRWDNQWTSVGFDKSLDHREENLSDANTYFDLGGGLAYFFGSTDESVKLHLGVAGYHLNQPDINFLGEEVKLDRRIVFNGGVQIAPGVNRLVFYPNFVHINQGPNQMTMIGSDFGVHFGTSSRSTGFLSKSSASVGAYYRLGSAFVPMVKLQAGGFQVGISYDITIGNLPRANDGFGGPEFSLIWKGGFGSGKTTRSVNSKFL